eukprot:1159760-Pelagomonas_calceolata.AAC.3
MHQKACHEHIKRRVSKGVPQVHQQACVVRSASSEAEGVYQKVCHKYINRPAWSGVPQVKQKACIKWCATSTSTGLHGQVCLKWSRRRTSRVSCARPLTSLICTKRPPPLNSLLPARALLEAGPGSHKPAL